MVWRKITSSSEFQLAIKESSRDRVSAVVIFKHSTRCSISSMAKLRLERHWKFNDEELPIYYLDLLNYRDVSNEIASILDVQHESPQMLVIQNGKLVYTSSHSEIDAEVLNNYV